MEGMDIALCIGGGIFREVCMVYILRVGNWQHCKVG